MNKFLKYSLVLAAVASLSACSNEVEEIFDGSAADRLNQATAEASEILTSKTNGWALQMFTTEREPGYTFLCDFSSNGSVKIAGNHKWINNTYTEETSLFQMIADNGPGLSFSTYNNVFHILATPEDISETNVSEQGYGHQGDYEFILMDVKSDYILLKGKKYGQKAILRPLAEGVQWEEYLTGLSTEQTSLFSTKIPAFKMVTSKGEYTITHPDYGYFYMLAPNGDPVTDTEYIPYVVSPGEVILWDAYTGTDGEISVENFAIADDGYLRCTDSGNTDVYIAAPAAAEILASPFTVMTLSEDSNGNQNPNLSTSGVSSLTFTDPTGNLATAIDDFGAALKKYNSTWRGIRSIRWNYQPAYGRVAINILTYKVTFNLYLDATVEDGKIRLTDNGEGDSNGLVVRNKVAYTPTFLSLFTAGLIEATADAPLQISAFTLTLSDGSTVQLPLN